MKTEYDNTHIQETGEATGILPAKRGEPVQVFGTQAIRETFDPLCIQQAMNTQAAPGVSHTVLNPDAHCGYGAPVGCVLASPTHVYPGPVGVDIKCSMSYLQFDLPESEIQDKELRRRLITAIGERTPTGAGKHQRSVKKGRRTTPSQGIRFATEGATPENCRTLGIPEHWANHCEDSFHVGHDGTTGSLLERLTRLEKENENLRLVDKLNQFGTYGSGNHFGECEVTSVQDSERARKAAKVFGLKDGHVGFLTHCGSRGFGYNLADNQFKTMEKHFEDESIPLPAGDRQLVYAELGTQMANDYIDDMSLGGNFATMNHLLINALILEAFQEVIPGVKGELVYFISHNIARKETLGDGEFWVHRKGATRAFPAGHSALAETPYSETGHPILLPGNPQAGSAIMVADEGAEKSCFSVNHGAGRVLSRRAAKKRLDQQEVNESFEDADILTNCRKYPLDEAPAAYKDFNEVLRSVKSAGLASEVARLKAKFVIKDADKSYGGAA